MFLRNNLKRHLNYLLFYFLWNILLVYITHHNSLPIWRGNDTSGNYDRMLEDACLPFWALSRCLYGYNVIINKLKHHWKIQERRQHSTFLSSWVVEMVGEKNVNPYPDLIFCSFNLKRESTISRSLLSRHCMTHISDKHKQNKRDIEISLQHFKIHCFL